MNRPSDELIEEALAAMRAAHGSPSDDVEAAVLALARREDYDAVVRGSRWLLAEGADERELYTRLLTSTLMPDAQLAATCTELLLSEQEPRVIRWLVYGLRESRQASSLDLVKTFAQHPSSHVRFGVPDALTACARGLDEIADELLGLSRDPDADVRWSAVYELFQWAAETHDERLRARLAQVAEEDPAAEVRRAAQGEAP